MKREQEEERRRERELELTRKLQDEKIEVEKQLQQQKDSLTQFKMSKFVIILNSLHMRKYRANLH